MKRLYLLLIICLLCGCGTEKIKLKESVVIEFYSITSCGECKAFKKNAIPYIKKKLENQVTIRMKDLDNQKDLKDYEQIVKKLRKEGKTEKEIEDIVFKEITTKEELLSNIEKKEKEKKKGKGDSYTSKFIEKYNDRISAIKNLDQKESEEEKKLFENFFKKTRKIDNTGKIKAQEQIKTRNSNRGNIKNSSSLNDGKRENEEETNIQ